MHPYTRKDVVHILLLPTTTVATVVSVMQKKMVHVRTCTYICTFVHLGSVLFSRLFFFSSSLFLGKAGKNRRTLAPSRSPVRYR